MDKRYQVFVSSTFADLIQERRCVMQALLELHCIPAGMELFPASTDDQWTLIRRDIDDCDYYVVIVGGRYGSVDAEGLSYTEREYDYAVQTGIPVMGFLHSAPEMIPLGKSDGDNVRMERLKQFRGKVERKHCKYWINPDDLGAKVSRSLVQIIKDHPAEGWVRGRYAKAADIVTHSLAVQEKYLDQMREAGYAWLTEIRDSLGNRNVNSWGKGTNGDWSDPVITTVHSGDEIRLHAEGACANDALLEYRFSVQNRGFSVRQDWSTVSEWSWNVADDDIGRDVVAMISVRLPKPYYQFSNLEADDYTYAKYDVLPKATNMALRNTEE